MVVVAVALLGFLALDRMSRDIFPDLGVPVLYVAQPYGGLDPPLRTHLPEWPTGFGHIKAYTDAPARTKAWLRRRQRRRRRAGKNRMQHGADASLLSINRQVYHISG